MVVVDPAEVAEQRGTKRAKRKLENGDDIEAASKRTRQKTSDGAYPSVIELD